MCNIPKGFCLLIQYIYIFQNTYIPNPITYNIVQIVLQMYIPPSINQFSRIPKGWSRVQISGVSSWKEIKHTFYSAATVVVCFPWDLRLAKLCDVIKVFGNWQILVTINPIFMTSHNFPSLQLNVKENLPSTLSL